MIARPRRWHGMHRRRQSGARLPRLHPTGPSVSRRIDELARGLRAAETANEAKTAFLATVSHDIRTPMAGIIGLADVLCQSSLTPYQSDLVQSIRESSQALMAIVDDLLDFSKIEAGRLELERSPVDVRELVEGVCDVLRVMAVNRGVLLHVHVDPSVSPRVSGDALRLRQILDNLVGNAIKFSAGLARAGRVQVRVTPGDAGLRLAVRDNGIGMDETVRARLFQPYAQGERSTSRRYGGTGLGLSIVRRLVQAFGGRIEVQSEPDRGSTFVVELPLRPAPDESGGERIEPSLLGLRVILSLADEVAARDWATDIGAAGAAVLWYPDAQTVEQALQSDAPGSVLVLTDADTSAAAKAALRRLLVRHGHRLVCIGHGTGRSPKLDARGDVQLSSDALSRSALLLALACAAGRQALPAAPALRSAEARTAVPSAEQARAQGRLILVADDDPINQMLTCRQLELLGFAAESADDGQQALERWRSGRHALLLTDLLMPGLDGLGLARHIREEEAGSNRRLPIIALTAAGNGDEGARCRSAGIDDWLRKPVASARLAELLAQHLPPVDAHERVLAPPAPEPALLVFDAAVLPRTTGNNAEVGERVLGAYAVSARNDVDALRQAVQRADWRSVQSLTHRLKGSSRTVGAMALGALCERIERAARAGDGSAVAAAHKDVDDAWAAVQAHVRRQVDWRTAESEILLVDDDPVDLQVLQQQMRTLHAGPVDAVASAIDALARLSGRDTSRMLLVTDVDMPGMDGIELIRALAGSGFAGALVLVSAADERVLECGARLALEYQLNFIGHLPKPVSAAVLGRMLSCWKSLRPPQPRRVARRYGADELRRALAGNEIVLHYQPQVSLADRALVAVEALARWQHPRDGLVYPDSFVPLAEEHGLIGGLTDTVIGLAFAQQERWRAQGLVLPVAVNVSMDNLVQLDFPERLLERLREHHLPPQSLHLEVTESRLMRDPCAAIEILARLRLHRIGLAIDDFGTGHSSLAQLRDLPFDELKIDRGFVRGCSERTTQRGILVASIVMAHELRMKTVAEGVEDADDWNAVVAAGCDRAQGWFIARPMPGAQMLAWAAEYAAQAGEPA